MVKNNLLSFHSVKPVSPQSSVCILKGELCLECDCYRRDTAVHCNCGNGRSLTAEQHPTSKLLGFFTSCTRFFKNYKLVWDFFYLIGSKSLNKNSSHKVGILISQVIPHFHKGISQTISWFPGNLAEEKDKLNIVLTD